MCLLITRRANGDAAVWALTKRWPLCTERDKLWSCLLDGKFARRHLKAHACRSRMSFIFAGACLSSSNLQQHQACYSLDPRACVIIAQQTNANSKVLYGNYWQLPACSANDGGDVKSTANPCEVLTNPLNPLRTHALAKWYAADHHRPSISLYVRLTMYVCMYVWLL